MLKNIYTASAVILFCLSIFFGCKAEETPETVAESSTATSDDSGVFAKINDVVISNNDFQTYAKAKRAAQPNGQFTDKNIADEMIATEILHQEALKQGIGDRADIIEQIKRQKSNILINTLMSEKFAELSFTDEELQAEYDRQIGLADFNEYKARHILLQTEDEAKTVIEELKAGANFEELAKTKSQGPSAPNGGDLGWFKADTMVPAFAEAVRNMDKGTYSTEGVNTRFGWHVILLEDTRSTEKPEFESVKQNVQQNLTRQAIEKYVDELEAQATIMRSDEETEPQTDS